VVLVADADLDRARARADRVAERIAVMKDDVESVEALTALAPAAETQAARFAARDALDLPAKAADLERALAAVGFAPERFAAVIAGMRAPPRQEVALADLERGPASVLLSRYLAEDAGERLVAVYVRPRDGQESIRRIEQAIREADPQASLTGYSRLEASLRETLARACWRIGRRGAARDQRGLAAGARDVIWRRWW
jgi:hypothetical protein